MALTQTFNRKCTNYYYYSNTFTCNNRSCNQYNAPVYTNSGYSDHTDYDDYYTECSDSGCSNQTTQMGVLNPQDVMTTQRGIMTILNPILHGQTIMIVVILIITMITLIILIIKMAIIVVPMLTIQTI